jgi:ubiquinone/menaquinone biosynthesis C-methylase UbiE
MTTPNEAHKAVAEQVAAEFNRWAEAGKGEEMEREHRRITEQMLALMQFRADDNIFDLGCGAGWLCRILAALAPEGRVVGMDIADEMVRRARKNTVECGNVVIIAGGVDEIPWEDNFFTQVVSVESAYYWPHPAQGIREIYRVLRDGGSAWILINYYRDNPHCHQWGPLLPIPTKLLSADEWAGFFRDAGFVDVAHRQIPDDSPAPETYTGRWFRDAAHLRAFREAGALLVHGTKTKASATDGHG